MVKQFTGIAKKITVEDQEIVSVWSDGVALNADNGKSKFMGGMSAECLLKLNEGEEYRVIVQKVPQHTSSDDITICGFIFARHIMSGMRILDPIEDCGAVVTIKSCVLNPAKDEDDEETVLLSTSLGFAEISADKMVTLVATRSKSE